MESGDMTALYNDLYLYVEELTLQEAERSAKAEINETAGNDSGNDTQVSQEYLELYLT